MVHKPEPPRVLEESPAPEELITDGEGFVSAGPRRVARVDSTQPDQRPTFALRYYDTELGGYVVAGSPSASSRFIAQRTNELAPIDDFNSHYQFRECLLTGSSWIWMKLFLLFLFICTSLLGFKELIAEWMEREDEWMEVCLSPNL